MQFTDSTGKTWVPRVDCNAVRRFEERSGVGLFQAVFDAVVDVEELKQGKGKGKKKSGGGNRARGGGRRDKMVATKLAKDIFGNLGNMLTFLHECCVDTRAADTLGLDDFCKRIGRAEIGDAMRCAIGCLLEFFPDTSDDDGTEERAEDAGPLSRMPGETSSGLQL